jgi:predicted transcriptional regulator of viral defense system
MDIDIERELLKFTNHIVDYASLSSVLKSLGYKSVNNKIEDLMKKAILSPLKRGLYVHKSKVHQHAVSPESIANHLLGPSYISLDFALSYYNLIPERVYEVTSVTTKRPKSFNTPVGLFSYRRIQTELFPLGLAISNGNHDKFLIATVEKAICDKIFLSKDIDIQSIEEMRAYLDDDLRIEMSELTNLNREIISIYHEVSKSKKINLFLKLITRL